MNNKQKQPARPKSSIDATSIKPVTDKYGQNWIVGPGFTEPLDNPPPPKPPVRR